MNDTDTVIEVSPNLDPNWFLVGLFVAFSVISILCYLEAENYHSSFELDPVPRTGKEMRLVFLRVLLACCITRAVSIGIEIPLWMYQSCPSSWGCTLVHTAPNLPFLTAYSLLALFWAQLAMSISNQHHPELAHIFKKWNAVLYGIFGLLAISVTVGALHRTIFIKSAVMLFGFYYLTALVLVVYFGFATFFAFKEESPKRNSPGGSPISYRPLSMTTGQESSSSVISPNRNQNKSPVQLAPSSSSSTGTTTPPLTNDIGGDIFNEKRAATLKKSICLCVFCGFILLIHTVFFLGSFLDIDFSFRRLHKNETIVAYEYLFLELLPSVLIMIILGSWKRRRQPDISLTMPMSIVSNQSSYGGMSRDSSYGDLKMNSRRSSVTGDRGGGSNRSNDVQRGGRTGVSENPGNGLGNFRNGVMNGNVVTQSNGIHNGGNGRNMINSNNNLGSRGGVHRNAGSSGRGGGHEMELHPSGSAQAQPLVTPQLIQPVARRLPERTPVSFIQNV